MLYFLLLQTLRSHSIRKRTLFGSGISTHHALETRSKIKSMVKVVFLREGARGAQVYAVSVLAILQGQWLKRGVGGWKENMLSHGDATLTENHSLSR